MSDMTDPSTIGAYPEDDDREDDGGGEDSMPAGPTIAGPKAPKPPAAPKIAARAPKMRPLRTPKPPKLGMRHVSQRLPKR
jgi:hypothetical protein